MALPQTRLRRRARVRSGESSSTPARSKLSLFSMKPSMTSPAPRMGPGPFRPDVKLDPSQVRDIRPKVRGTTLRSARSVRASRGPQPFAWLKGVRPAAPIRPVAPRKPGGRSRGGSWMTHVPASGSSVQRTLDAMMGKAPAGDMSNDERATVANARSRQVNATALATGGRGLLSLGTRLLRAGLGRGDVIRGPTRGAHLSNWTAGAASTQRPVRPTAPKPRTRLAPAVRRRARLR